MVAHQTLEYACVPQMPVRKNSLHQSTCMCDHRKYNCWCQCWSVGRTTCPSSPPPPPPPSPHLLASSVRESRQMNVRNVHSVHTTVSSSSADHRGNLIELFTFIIIISFVANITATAAATTAAAVAATAVHSMNVAGGVPNSNLTSSPASRVSSLLRQSRASDTKIIHPPFTILALLPEEEAPSITRALRDAQAKWEESRQQQPQPRNITTSIPPLAVYSEPANNDTERILSSICEWINIHQPVLMLSLLDTRRSFYASLVAQSAQIPFVSITQRYQVDSVSASFIILSLGFQFIISGRKLKQKFHIPIRILKRRICNSIRGLELQPPSSGWFLTFEIRLSR